MPRLIPRSEEHTSELQSPKDLVCRLLLEKKKKLPSLGAPTSPMPTYETRQPHTTPDRCSPALLSRRELTIPVRSYSPPFFFFNDTATTEIYTLSLHDALPISGLGEARPAQSSLSAGALCYRAWA